MNITISNTSDKPIYQQIFDQISSQVIKGELAPGFCLPPIRTAALELRVSIITVKKAWEELERQGFIYTMVGRGCFVADLSKNDMLDKRDKLIDEKLEKDVAYYKALGLSLDELVSKIIKTYSSNK